MNSPHIPVPTSVKLFRKLRSTTGETLVEVLVAVLVSGLSMLMLYAAISVAGHIVQNSNEVATKYYETTDALVEVAAASDIGVKAGNGVVDVAVTQGDHFAGESIPVTYANGELPGGQQGVTYQTDQAEG